MKKTIISLTLVVVLVVMTAAIVIVTKLHPNDVTYENIPYEEVEATVTGTDVRTGRTAKYITTHYYDVTIEYDGAYYVWSTSDDPKLTNGMKYDFYLCNGRMYRTKQEMQRNYSINNASSAYPVMAIIAAISMVMVMVLTLLIIRRRRG